MWLALKPGAGDHVLEARFPYHKTIVEVVKHCRWRWDPRSGCWWTNSPARADQLQKLAGLTLAQAVATVNAERQRENAAQNASVAASRAITSNFKVPLSVSCKRLGYDFFPFQKAGVEFMYRRENTLLADPMGLGKTPMVCGLINADHEIKNVLVICLKNLKYNWVRHCNLWLSREMRVSRLVERFPDPWYGDVGVVICHYEQVLKFRRVIDVVEWDLLVCDEANYLKNPRAQRSKAVLGGHFRAKSKHDATFDLAPLKAWRKVFVTGTPILNRPAELWSTVEALDPEGLGASREKFMSRYCDSFYGRYGEDESGASNLDELQAKLRASIMIRRAKADVLPELPPKRRQIIAFEADSAEAQAALVADQAQASRLDELERLMMEVEKLSDDAASEAYIAAAGKLKKARAVAFEETSAVRHRVAVAKVPQVIEHVLEILENEDKLVIMCWHHDIVDRIASALTEANVSLVTADGRNTERQRDEAWQRFQHEGNLRVFIGTIKAMGLGIDLTAASTMVFAEVDWVPGILEQTEDRCHRIGQQDSVLVQHLVLDGSMDQRMLEILISKMDVISAAMDRDELRLTQQEMIE